MNNPFEKMDTAANVMPVATEQNDVKNALQKLQQEMKQGEQNLMPEGA